MTAVDGDGGIPVVNRLLLDALESVPIRPALVSLIDAPDFGGRPVPPGSAAARGGRLRFLRAALKGRRSASGGEVFATHCGLAPVARLVAAAGGARRMSVFLHGVEAWGPLPLRTRWGLARADRFIANSGTTLRRFREAHPRFAGVPGEVCPLPARDLGDREAGEVPAAKGLRVLVVGRLWGRGLRKGQDALIRCWPRVLREHRDAELVVVGDGEGRGDLEALARDLGVEASVRFPGRAPDAGLAAWYESSDLFAMPAEGEGFGLVYAEAMARGIPCIAGSRDAGAETVIDGVTGVVVDPRDDESIGDAVLRLLGDGDLRRRMGDAGRRRAEEIYTVDAFRRRIGALFANPAEAR